MSPGKTQMTILWILKNSYAETHIALGPSRGGKKNSTSPPEASWLEPSPRGPVPAARGHLLPQLRA